MYSVVVLFADCLAVGNSNIILNIFWTLELNGKYLSMVNVHWNLA